MAIGTLRTAAKKTNDRGFGQLTDEVIDGAVPDGKTEIRRRSLEELTENHRTHYDIIPTNPSVPIPTMPTPNTRIAASLPLPHNMVNITLRGFERVDFASHLSQFILDSLEFELGL